ncbi:MAG: acyl-CoA dehydrogenase family protein [Caldilineaceae bacterium]|nr:acyl-CoA dehydrogenase family protein [Caldilineaceae bacterium]MBP8110364.1 acyl-CoA dehydrogenase family protein [Caldilineaceae bacterium]MBP8125326.1 acyl-CoA dehydrogenase family protein [Caldilineaceae bacterium]MBP9075132.1 acyl-CoA dehydrogenase family protein [Caldilineaceae bacterium]
MLTRIRHFLSEEILPLEPTLLQEGFGVLEPILAQKRLMAKELGLWTPHLPEEFGGMGLSLSEFAHISEELGTSPLGHYVCNVNAPDIGNMELLHLFGSPAQHEEWLRPLAEGKIRSCFAMTEPEHAGSNPVLMSTTAVKDGDDYVINGHKWFTTAADGAAFAVTMAITDPDASRYKRASQIIVPTDAPGYVHVRRIRIMGEEGEGFLSHSEVRFENCRVPQTNRLGDEGSGFALAQERLGPGRIHHTMRWLGIARRALDMTCAYAARRELAPGKPLATRQAVQHMIAESRAEIDAARLLVLNTAHKIDEEGAYAARVDISLIKFHVANVLQRVLDRAIQVHGGLGVTDDTVLSFWFRHERAARIYDGADEVHKSVVARRILRDYGVDISI